MSKKKTHREQGSAHAEANGTPPAAPGFRFREPRPDRGPDPACRLLALARDVNDRPDLHRLELSVHRTAAGLRVATIMVVTDDEGEPSDD